MDQQKIDRLFREKLDSFEVAPSAKSWSEVEKKIGANRNPIKFYWIAAAVSTIVISWVVWPQENGMEFTPIASDVDHPVLETTPDLTLPILERKTQEKLIQPKVKSQVNAQLVAQTPVKMQVKDVLSEKIEGLPLVELESKTAIAVVETEEIETTPMGVKNAVETVEEQVDNKIKVDLSKVKITYIAAAVEETKQEKDSVGTFKKFIAFAGKISPGDVLADIKTAKDDFINGGFKSKQKDRGSL
ncbi:MAG: hypothetical protein ABJG78_00480 [Cyclobacteriaceae bacterium]